MTAVYIALAEAGKAVFYRQAFEGTQQGRESHRRLHRVLGRFRHRGPAAR
jgi:hypothetical protein